MSYEPVANYLIFVFFQYPAVKSQLANIGPQESPPPTSPVHPLKILFNHPGDIMIWRPEGVPKWRQGDILIWRPRDVPGRLILDVPRMFSERPLEDLQNTSFGTMWGYLLNVPKFLFTFLLEFFQLTKSI